MTKTTKKSKGHRFDRVTYHLPYYTDAFFNPSSESTEDGEIAKANMVHIPIKIQADAGETRSNVTTFKMPGITHFDGNVEHVLDSFNQLQERIIKPRQIDNQVEQTKTLVQMMQFICNTSAASQTLQEACKTARQNVYDDFIAEAEEENDSVQEDILINDQTAFYDYLEKNHDSVFDVNEYGDTDEYTHHMYLEFERHFWNHLHSIIFGADAYRCFIEQKNYLLNMLIKPFGVSVEAAFRRIEIICNLMPFFPPSGSRGETSTQEQWEAFEEIKVIPSAVRREMKYNLLPQSYHERFDTLETDWREMTNAKFLAEAQKCEAIDARDREKAEHTKQKGKGKRKTEDDSSTANLSRSQASKNASYKKSRNEKKPSPQGEARLCELCKAAGAPDFVYKTHNTSACRKKEEYARKLSSSAGQRHSASREARLVEKYKRRELRLMAKFKKLKGKKRAKSSNDDDSMSSISSAGSDDVGY